jgi:uncharacterized protein YcfJ
MRFATVAAVALALSVVSPALEIAVAPAHAANYATESERAYCSKKATKYANKKAGNRTARNVFGGAAGGALIGGIFGGSGKDAAIGAVIGGTVGGIGSAASNKWYKYYNRAYYDCINN